MPNARRRATHLLHPMADMSRSPRPEYALDPGLTSYVGIFIVVGVRARRGVRRARRADVVVLRFFTRVRTGDSL